MSSSVAIEAVIVDDEFNAPELVTIGAKIVVKMPPNANLRTMEEKIMERYPALRDSLMNFYFFDDNGESQAQPTTKRFQYRSHHDYFLIFFSSLFPRRSENNHIEFIGGSLFLASSENSGRRAGRVACELNAVKTFVEEL